MQFAPRAVGSHLLFIFLFCCCLVAARFGSPSRAAPPSRGSSGPRAAHLGGLTSTSLWPVPVFDSRSGGAKWTQVSGNDEAAVGPDCPYTGHGPDGSLAACEAACLSAGAQTCTDINFSPTVPDCVFRRCVSPEKPALSPAVGYVVYAVARPVIPTRPVTPDFSFVVAPGSAGSAELSAALARSPLAAFPYGVPAASTPDGSSPLTQLAVYARAAPPLALGVDESYVITIGAVGAAALSANTTWGALRGLETFAQLCAWNASDGSYAVEAAEVFDAPRFPFRGLMVDASRHFLSLSALQRVVDEMAAVKLNALSVHFNDDTSWPLFIRSFPQLSLQGAYSNTSHTYTPPMMAALVEYARERGVRVLPEFDSPSHFGTLSGAYPELMAVQKDGGLCMLDPSKDATYEFLASVWGDIAAMFPDAQFRIGGDEFQGCWGACPTVMAWIHNKWGANGTIYDAYHYYVRRQIGILRGLSPPRATMAWLDVEGFPDARAGETWAKDYPDVTLNVWTGCYQGSWQSDTARFVAEGGAVVVSGPFYITTSATPHFTWTQMYETDLSNFTGGNTSAGHLVRGGEICAWDDAAGTDSGDLAMQITPFIMGAAEAWWSPRAYTSGVAVDEGRAHHHRCRMGQRGMATHPIYAFGTFCPQEFEVK